MCVLNSSRAMVRLHQQQGFSLLEVQLALGILALGFGLMSHLYLLLGLQGRLTYERQQAISVLQQMVTVLPHYHEHLAYLQSLSNAESPISVQACTLAQPCTANNMLASHWHSWQQQLAERLDDSALSFTCESPCQLGSRLTLEVAWSVFNGRQTVALEWRY